MAVKKKKSVRKARRRITSIGDEDALLAELDKKGGSAGNQALMKALRWDEARYWLVRDRLLRQGVLETGRGRGGSTRRTELLPIESAAAVREPSSEQELYQPIKGVLEEWAQKAKAFRFDDLWVENLALQGKRDTGGKWSRPDLALIGLTNYPYLPGKVLDVLTFEVKTADHIDVSAVYEALAHRRGATRSYVMLEVPNEQSELLEDALGIVRDEASRHGIGVIEFFKTRRY